MISKRLLSTLLTVSLGASVALMGCGNANNGNAGDDSAQTGPDKEQYLNVILQNEPKSLDASKSSDKYSSQVLADIMEGLTRIEQDENGKDVIKAAGAESWESNEDGTVWTFKLRENTWSDGEPVTAKDYVYGITRTLKGETGSPYAFLLYPIKNARAFNSGKVDASQLGVVAKDDMTLEFTLESPTAFFLDLTYFKVMHPQRQDKVEAAGDRYGTEMDTMVFNGPFVMTNWVHQSKIEFEKNPNYWDKDSVKLEKATLKIITDESARMSELFNGSIDTASVTHPDWVAKFDETEKFNVMKGYDPSTTYTFFNQNNKYFKNDKIRKAFILAEDREGRVSTLFRNLAEPAYGFVPPSLQIGGEDFRSLAGEQPLEKLKAENPDPKALLIEGLKEIGENPDPATMDITMLEAGTGARNKEFAEFAQQNYKKVLGVEPKVEYVEWPIFSKRTDEMDYTLASMAWNGDYNDPMTFLDMWLSDANVVPTGWANEKFDNIVKEAGSILDQEKRLELFKQAENILLYEDGVISPGVYRQRQTYVRKYVKGLMNPLFGTLDLKYAYTEGR